jgi:hypothetical protein
VSGLAEGRRRATIPAVSVPVARRPRSRVAVAIAVSAAIVGLAGCGGDGDDVDASATKRWAPSPIGFGFRADADAASRFLELAAARQTTTYRVDGAFERDVDGREPLTSAYTEINRPPDHVTVSLGGVSGRIGDRTITCGDLPGGASGCAPTAPAPAVEAERAAQLDELRSLVDPDTGWYRVDAADGLTVAGEAATCFGLRQRNELAAPPFGRWAYLCDAADGVPLSVYVVKVASRDVRTATAVSRAVTADDVTALVTSATGG